MFLARRYLFTLGGGFCVKAASKTISIRQLLRILSKTDLKFKIYLSHQSQTDNEVRQIQKCQVTNLVTFLRS
jgi:hypothetical protein